MEAPITIADGVRIRLSTFLSHIERTPTCWLWTGRRSGSGYGQYSEGKPAHRVAYRLWVGPIADDMTVDHLCFVATCVNPAHLRVLSMHDNAVNQRSARKTHCKNGHEFTPDNTYFRTPACTGKRQCRKCNSLAQQRRKRRALTATSQAA